MQIYSVKRFFRQIDVPSEQPSMVEWEGMVYIRFLSKPILVTS